MKAISVWQPWAQLIACGAKPYETRHWPPPRDLIGTTIAIHAAKKVNRAAAALAEDLVYGQHPAGGFDLADRIDASFCDAEDEHCATFGRAALPAGCVVALARLDAAFQLGERSTATAVPAATVVRRLTSRAMPECFTVRIDDFGDYSPGRWAWLLTDVRPLMRPALAVGRQGFFDLPQGWLTEC